jgi:hypothetical protein
MKCEPKTPKEILGAEKVISAFGSWPCFHDAEVISFSAERELPVRKGATTARLAVHVREYTAVGEGTVDYDIKETKSVLIRFLFKGACDFEISDFNLQNVIDSIEISQVDADDPANLKVNIEPIWGFGGSLRCEVIEIEAVEIIPIESV